MEGQFKGMTRSELVRELLRRETYLRQDGLQALVQELETHRQELACQSRQMRGAESLIHDERNRYSELYDSVPLPLLTLDVHGAVLEANRSACAFFGLEQTSLVGRSFGTLIEPASRGTFRSHLLHCRYGEAGIVSAAVKLRDKQNGSRLVELRTQAVSGPRQTRFRTALFSAHDSTWSGPALKTDEADLQAQLAQRTAELQAAQEQLQQETARRAALEAQLQASEAKFRGLIQGESVGIGIWHADGRLTDANQALLNLLGYSREDLQQLPLRWTTITPPEYAELDQQMLRQLRAAGRCKPFERELLRRDGSRVPVMVGPALLPGSADEGIAFVLDLSERKVAERLLQKSEQRERERSQELRTLTESLNEVNRRKDQFLAMLGHELRNPLGPLTNAFDLLRRHGPQTEEVDELWEIVQRQIGQLSRLVDDLLDVSRISAGRISLKRYTVDLAEIVRRTASDFGCVVADSGLSIRVSTPDGPVWVDGDSTRLAQVIGNLINNACKFTDAGGEIDIGLTVEGERARLQVRDTGIGIRSELLDQLFSAFVQVDDSVDRSRGGLGLGLALVRGLVELHGGEVCAESDGIGTGTRFIVSLPVVSNAALGGDVAKFAPSDGLRVLVVEDHRDSGFMLCKLLQALGHEVIVATDGKLGLTLGIEFKPDLVLADIGLPEMDGCAMAQALRALPEFQTTYFVALSGYGQPADQQRALQAGYDQHLTKPATTETLQWVLRLAAARRTGPPV